MDIKGVCSERFKILGSESFDFKNLCAYKVVTKAPKCKASVN